MLSAVANANEAQDNSRRRAGLGGVVSESKGFTFTYST
jgi:hypothetical protein